MRGIRNRMTIMQIRGLQNSDVDPVAAIWLNTNLKTHDFIAAQYWKDNGRSGKSDAVTGRSLCI